MMLRPHEYSNRISLRSKVTTVTVLMLTLGLFVAGFGTAAMLRSYVEQQAASKLEKITDGGVTDFFQPIEDPEESDTSLAERPFRDTTGVYVALYDDSGSFVRDNWNPSDPSTPQIPAILTESERSAMPGESVVIRLKDQDQHETFRGVITLLEVDDYGTRLPFIIAISTTEDEELLAFYLVIFFCFGLGVVVIGGVLTRMVVTSTFRPLREVERTAAAIADGDFSQRLDGATPNTEVGRLNRSLNTMLATIDGAFRDRLRTIHHMRRFVGDASHELRTPLVSVRGYAELYRMGALTQPEEVAQAMERIEKEAVRLEELVNDLLALARLDEAKPLQLTEVDLVPLVGDAVLDAHAANPDRPITLEIIDRLPAASPVDDYRTPHSGPSLAGEFLPRQPTGIFGPHSSLARFFYGRMCRAHRQGAPGSGRSQQDVALLSLAGVTTAITRLPLTAAVAEARLDEPSASGEGNGTETEEATPIIVLAEENRIRQVISNLMSNALRFTPENSPITLRVGRDHGTQKAMIEVVDHGEGIAPQVRDKIFQRFWRADTSRARETGGTGLGLSIVQSIVAMHNGTVEVSETPGGGATFRVWLPMSLHPTT